MSLFFSGLLNRTQFKVGKVSLDNLELKFSISGWMKNILCIRELLFTLFKIKHFSLYACCCEQNMKNFIICTLLRAEYSLYGRNSVHIMKKFHYMHAVACI